MHMSLNNSTLTSIIVTDFQGAKINLVEKFGDQAILLLFYNNSCLGCTGRAIPLAYEIQKEYSQLKVIGIHSNFGNQKATEEDIRSIFTIDELPFPIYLDEEHKLYDQFQCEGTPHWILIDKEGRIFNSIFGSQSGAQNRLFYAIDELMEPNN